MPIAGPARAAREHQPLVGRAEELRVFEQALDGLDRGRPSAIELVGGPGIGKTRLLRELATRAELRRHLVLSGSASELERELPFSVFVDALDEYVEGLHPDRLAALDDDVRADLASVLPSLCSAARARKATLQHERYRTHRAVRKLLGQLAKERPLVLVLDDFHWADSASAELLAALLRRPPAGAVLIALAGRPRQMPDVLVAGLERAHRDAVLIQIDVGVLSLAEAQQLLGDELEATEIPRLYEASGGNPFYLEQLARTLRKAGDAASVADVSVATGIPSAVAAVLSEELARLSDDARLVIEGAAVAGDPFEPELAAVAALTPEGPALDAIDDLLRLDLVRATDVPRRFRFRHPLVRRAVYEATPAGWRLSAHERCAEALSKRGAPAAARAHHIERSAREGDPAAVAVLREAGDATAALAPASAAHWFAAALRLLPQAAPSQDRVDLLLAHARALTAAGRFADSRAALLECLAIVPDESRALRSMLTTRCARAEHRLGQYEQAHARLSTELAGLPGPDSPEAVDLMIELALNELYRSKYESMRAWAERAADVARLLGDAPLLAAALAMPALAAAMTGAGERARALCGEAAALVDSLSDRELSRRLGAAAWLAAAELYVDLYTQADVHAGRALTLARASGREEVFLVVHQVLGRVLFVRGKLNEATDLLDGAIEAARLAGHTQALAGNLFNRSVVAVAVGDLDTALVSAQQSVELTRDLDDGFVTAWAAVRLADALLETGQPERAVGPLLASAGGEDLVLIPGGWRAYCLELLTRCWLTLDQHAEAQRAAACASAWASTVQLPLAATWARRAGAALALHVGDFDWAAEQALASAASANEAGAPIEAALSRTLAGRSLARAGETHRAVTELQRAAEQLDATGAVRYRDKAERELGKLGHRTHRRTRPGKPDESGIDSLTERELQVARLVVDRKTNPEIAAELFLSQKTVETHLRTIFRKMDVPSRVALARAIEQADRVVSARAG